MIRILKFVLGSFGFTPNSSPITTVIIIFDHLNLLSQHLIFNLKPCKLSSLLFSSLSLFYGIKFLSDLNRILIASYPFECYRLKIFENSFDSSEMRMNVNKLENRIESDRRCLEEIVSLNDSTIQ
ncbi:hypothetical protein SSS_10651 [Sarcoptes scabiei]|nr:hypothetical protein SSS_10651 [Sarcoptes scabiei]